MLANCCCCRFDIAYNGFGGIRTFQATLMLNRVEVNLFFEQAVYLVLFASNAGGV
jgi:hypothetical protein